MQNILKPIFSLPDWFHVWKVVLTFAFLTYFECKFLPQENNSYWSYLQILEAEKLIYVSTILPTSKTSV